MYSRDWLAGEIVKLGEKYPDLVAPPRWSQCIVGTISHGAGTVGIIGYTPDAVELACSAVVLNDSGVPWGQIPVRLGLTRAKVMSNTGELVAV